MPPTGNTLTFRLVAENELSPEEGQAIEHLDHTAFANEAPPTAADGTPIEWGGSDAHVLGFLGERLACHVGLTFRAIQINGWPLQIAGVGGVATAPELQGQGLGRRIMQATGEIILSSPQYDAGMLFCAEKRIQFYTRCGWQKISNPIYIQQSRGKIHFDANVLVLLREGAAWPTGDLDTCGLPW